MDKELQEQQTSLEGNKALAMNRVFGVSSWTPCIPYVPRNQRIKEEIAKIDINDWVIICFRFCTQGMQTELNYKKLIN